MAGAVAARRAAVFLDRDGTVIRDHDYLAEPDRVELLPTAAQAIALLNAAGVPVFLVTNQSGIGRGLFGEADFQAVQRRLAELLRERGAWFDDVYHCPHAPDDPDCGCRKPAPGLFLRAAGEHALDLSRSFFIGDRPRDLEPALRFGGTPILVRPPDAARREREPVPRGTRVVDTLHDATLIVLAKRSAD